MAIEIVDFPIKMVIFHSFWYVYQRVNQTKKGFDIFTPWKLGLDQQSIAIKPCVNLPSTGVNRFKNGSRSSKLRHFTSKMNRIDMNRLCADAHLPILEEKMLAVEGFGASTNCCSEISNCFGPVAPHPQRKSPNSLLMPISPLVCWISSNFCGGLCSAIFRKMVLDWELYVYMTGVWYGY